MNLIVHLFRYDDLGDDQKLKRQEEIETCVFDNYKNENIKSVHVFLSPQDEEYFRELLPKAEFIVSEKVPTYKSMINYANLSMKRDSICCIAKNDVTFGELKLKLLHAIKRDELYSLTSYEKSTDINKNTGKYYFENYTGRHDAFIFRTPAKIDLNNVNYVQDMTNIENRLHLEFKKGNYKIINPCIQIPIYHFRNHIFSEEKYEPICSQSEIKKSEVKPSIVTQTVFSRTFGGRLKIVNVAY